MIKLKKKTKILIMTVLILTLSVGYSAISSNISIAGIIKIAGGQYTVTIKNTSTTTSASSLTLKLNGNGTLKVTPASGYYLASASCTNGYTISNVKTGADTYNTAQTVTINNNSKKALSTCTFVSKKVDASEVSYTNSNYSGITNVKQALDKLYELYK